MVSNIPGRNGHGGLEWRDVKVKESKEGWSERGETGRKERSKKVPSQSTLQVRGGEIVTELRSVRAGGPHSDASTARSVQSILLNIKVIIM